jgi:DNA modification methylase
MKLTDIKPNPNNPRVIKDEKFEKLVQSIKDFPEMIAKRNLVCVTDAVDGKIFPLGGNMRLKALQHLKYKDIPGEWVTMADEWTEEQRREFIIKDNVGYGDWDWAALGETFDEETLKGWGLEIPDFAFKQETVEDDYEIPDEIETDIVLGDLFEIGPHRLLCGSSTEADAVTKLLNGKEPYLMVTDPPYGVNYDPMWRATQESKGFGAKVKAKGKVMNDDKADWTETYALSPSKVAYVWHGGKHAGEVGSNLEKCDFEIRSQIIWVKPSLTFSRGDYHWQHEPCWYAVKKGNKGNWAGDRKQTTTWQIAGINPAGRSRDKNDVVVGHGTQKPIECMARPIGNHDGDVYDPFLGSGTTMVASHQLNRKCYGIELDPKYCQVIVDRMLKLDPTIEIKRNGQPYQKTINI